MEMREASTKGELAMQGCLGKPKLFDLIHDSHNIIYPELAIDKQLTEAYRGKPLMVCRTCGRFAQLRVDYLKEPCSGRPEAGSSGAKALQRLAQGLHPRNVGGPPKRLSQKLLAADSLGPEHLAETGPAQPAPPKERLAGGDRLALLRERVRRRLQAAAAP